MVDTMIQKVFVPLVFVAFTVESFQLHVGNLSPRSPHNHPCHFRRQAVSTDGDKYVVENDVLGGVEAFEEWWQSFTKNRNTDVRHGSFINNYQILRGLECVGKTATFGEGLPKKIPILQIPRSKILSAPFSGEKARDDDWDTSLAWNLLEECRKGHNSSIYGYCSLLTKGQAHILGSSLADKDLCPEVPESTAPDALRHWTTEQKQYLQKSSKGRRLVELEEKQRLLWEQKYYHSDSRKRAANTLPQFLWAMEVVHSRAFCGDFGSLNPANLIVSLSVPIIATFIGYKSLIDSYTSYTTGYNEVIAILCAATAALVPLYYSQKNDKVAVLLPFIDSANHLQTADSSVEYNVFQDCIVLNAGPKCFVKSNTANSKGGAVATGAVATQLFINYGESKDDTELLLNYGFLNNNNDNDDNYVKNCSKLSDNTTAYRDFIRKKLAEVFLERYSD
jgi:hypothetical protein